MVLRWKTQNAQKWSNMEEQQQREHRREGRPWTGWLNNVNIQNWAGWVHVNCEHSWRTHCVVKKTEDKLWDKPRQQHNVLSRHTVQCMVSVVRQCWCAQSSPSHTRSWFTTATSDTLQWHVVATDSRRLTGRPHDESSFFHSDVYATTQQLVLV